MRSSHGLPASDWYSTSRTSTSNLPLVSMPAIYSRRALFCKSSKTKPTQFCGGRAEVGHLWIGSARHRQPKPKQIFHHEGREEHEVKNTKSINFRTLRVLRVPGAES